MMSSSPPATSDVFNLLALLADPDKFKAQMDEFAKQASDAAKASVDYQSIAAEVEAKRKETADNLIANQVILDQVSAAKTAMETTLVAQQADITKLAQDLDTRGMSIASQERELATKALQQRAAFDNRETSLLAREALASKLHTDSSALMTQAQALMDNYSAKEAKLKEIVG